MSFKESIILIALNRTVNIKEVFLKEEVLLRVVSNKLFSPIANCLHRAEGMQSIADFGEGHRRVGKTRRRTRIDATRSAID